VPYIAKRSIPVLDDKNTSKKLERWNMIAKEACEQSKRNKLVKVLEPVKLKELLNYKSELNLIAYEDLNCVGSSHFYSLIEKNPKSITIVVGPEGGFDSSEVAFLNENDFISVSLGKRILRSETAPLYMLSVIGFMNERNK
jgi:16S rRNA (uracil1498-N3)-methyltransferase